MSTMFHSPWIGEKAVRECIAQGRKFADASQGPDKGRMRKVCDDLDRLMGDLAELRRQGKVSTVDSNDFGEGDFTVQTV